jgi:hypothetical protein
MPAHQRASAPEDKSPQPPGIGARFARILFELLNLRLQVRFFLQQVGERKVEDVDVDVVAMLRLPGFG